MIAQAFFYNAIFFTYATILTTYYGVLPENVGIFELPFCLGSTNTLTHSFSHSLFLSKHKTLSV